MKGTPIFDLTAYIASVKTLVVISAVALIGNVASAATLEEIYELALQNDPQRKADVAAYEAGKETVKIARSQLLPFVRGSANYNDRESTTEGTQFSFDPVTNTIGIQPVNQDRASESDGWTVSLTQPLFDMGAWYSYKQGGKRSEIAEANFGASQQDFIIRVADTYISVLRAIDTLDSSLAERRALESQLEQVRQRFEVGLTAITDVHDAQAQYDSVNANTLLAEGNLGIAFEALEVLIGVTPDAVAPVSDTFPVNPPQPAQREEWVNFALDNNYSLEAAKLNAEAARYTALTAKSQHYPTLSGTLSYSSDNTVQDSQFGPSDTTTDGNSVSLSLNIPIYSGGGVSAQRRQAYQQQLQAEENYNLAQRQTVQSARSFHLAVVTGVSQVEARRQAIISNQSSLEATQAGYEVGTRNLVDVLLAQRNLYQAQRAYSAVLYDYIINTLRLKQTAGTLTPEDIDQLNQFLDAANQIRRSDYGQ